MFDRFDIRYKIVLIWLLAFIALWITFQRIFPLKSMESQLNRIEESIERKNWIQANEYTSMFRDNFKKNALLIQMNNSTEALTYLATRMLTKKAMAEMTAYEMAGLMILANVAA